MIVTEDEAKTKSCPFGDGKKDVKNNGGNCVASKCMLWRPAISNDRNDIGFCGLSNQDSQIVKVIY